jgi:tetratricopeptide (TPR) repeat protein
MSAHVARAQLLLAQSRPADAERELLLALSAQPDDTTALALLSLSRSDQNKGPEALAAAETAIGLAPGNAYLHYVHAAALHRRDRTADARRAIEEALRLNPGEEDYFSLLASIELAARDWPAALTAAEQALALNPEHVNAANLRAVALVRLNRKEEAAATVEFALHREPDNAFSHANQGWNCLHHNDPKKAQEHFREALRLSPGLEYARQGMIEALKARNPIYRGMLAYFLWMGRQRGWLQAAVIVAFLVATFFLSEFTGRYPLLWIPLLGVYLFIYLTWTSDVAFNLLLQLDRFGRHVLNRDQRIGAFCYGGIMLASGIALALAFMVGPGLPFLAASIILLVGSICVAVTFRRAGRSRWLFVACTIGLVALGLTGAVLLVVDRPQGVAALRLFQQGFFFLQILTFVVRE